MEKDNVTTTLRVFRKSAQLIAILGEYWKMDNSQSVVNKLLDGHREEVQKAIGHRRDALSELEPSGE